MVNNTFNPTITGNLFYFYAPPMGHSFNPLLHQPLIPPLGQQMSCHFTAYPPCNIIYSLFCLKTFVRVRDHCYGCFVFIVLRQLWILHRRWAHFTDFHPSQINRFHLVGYTVILYLGTSLSKKKINYGSLTGQLYQLNTTEICQLDSNILS